MLDDRLEVLPKLRFREFKTPWKECKLAHILKVGSGKDYKHLNEGNIPVYGTGGYMLSVDDFLHEGKSVCIGRKGTIDNPVLLDGKFWTVDTLFYTHDYDGVVPEFLFALFQNIRWKKYNEASGVPSLSKSTIESIKTWVSQEDHEQQKIADFLSSVDKKISLLTEKHTLLIQYKKGVMQKLFKQEIRFKDDDGNDFPDWELKKGNKIFDAISNKNHDSDLPILAITQEHGAIPRDLINYQVQVTEGSVAGYKVVDIGDFIISLRSFQGGIEYSNYKGICSPAYIILRPSIKVNDDFYRYYLKTGNFIQEMKKRLEGIRDGKILSYKYFSEINLPNPSVEEQQKIAVFLGALDSKINAVNEQIELTQTFKKGLLQQMFV